ncbi:MAG: TolC family protein [Pseudomonadota bacterium]
MLSQFFRLRACAGLARPSTHTIKACALMLAVLAPPALAQEVLTLERAQRLALARSGQLAAQDHAIDAAREMAVAAAQLPDPVLKLGVDNLPISGADRLSTSADFMTMRRVGLMQEVTRADKRQLRAQRFDREAAKAQADKDSGAAAIARDSALAWFERFYAEASAELFAQQIAQAALALQAAQAAYRAGQGTQADLLGARAALAALEERASDAQRRMRSARLMLARWIGEAGEQALGGPPAMDSVGGASGAELAHHPAMLAMRRQQEMLETDVALARANRRADWSLELSFQQRGPAYGNMVSAGVSIPLQWDRGQRQDRELAARLALAAQAGAERDEALRAHVAETQALLGDWENSRERRGRYERELIPLALQRSEALLAAYRGGKASLSEVLAARRAELELRLQALQLDAETARLWTQLSFLAAPSMNGASNKEIK